MEVISANRIKSYTRVAIIVEGFKRAIYANGNNVSILESGGIGMSCAETTLTLGKIDFNCVNGHIDIPKSKILKVLATDEDEFMSHEQRTINEFSIKSWAKSNAIKTGVDKALTKTTTTKVGDNAEVKAEVPAPTGKLFSF